MAKLVATPKEIAKAMEMVDGEDFNVYSVRAGKAFAALQAESDALPDGEVVGAMISFPWADGHAFYRVMRAKPLQVAHIPYMDAWHVDPLMIRGLRVADVLKMLERHRGLKGMSSSRGKA